MTFTRLSGTNIQNILLLGRTTQQVCSWPQELFLRNCCYWQFILHIRFQWLRCAGDANCISHKSRGSCAWRAPSATRAHGKLAVPANRCAGVTFRTKSLDFLWQIHSSESWIACWGRMPCSKHPRMTVPQSCRRQS